MKLRALFATGIVLASSAAFAAKDQCHDYLQQVDREMSSRGGELEKEYKDEAKMHLKQARDAQKAGDTEGCVMHAKQAMEVLGGEEGKGRGSPTEGNFEKGGSGSNY